METRSLALRDLLLYLPANGVDFTTSTMPKLAWSSLICQATQEGDTTFGMMMGMSYEADIYKPRPFMETHC